MPSFAARAPRCTIANVATGESIACLFNPAQLTEKVSTLWNHLAVPGLSHPAMQYQSTGSRQLSGVEFFVDRIVSATRRPVLPVWMIRGHREGDDTG